MKLALNYTYNLVLKHNFCIILSSNPGHLNPGIDLIIAVISEKILDTNL